VKAYLVVTGSIFAIIGVAHLLRLFVEEHPCRALGSWRATLRCS
jgi:hypothetical protein